MRIKGITVALAGTMLAAWATPASAVTLVDATSHVYSPTSSWGGINVTSLGIHEGGMTGRFAVSGTYVATGLGFNALTYCTDVTTAFYDYSTYRIDSAAGVTLNAIKQAQLAGLLVNSDALFNAAATATQREAIATATGLAVWEIVYESGVSGYSLTDANSNFSVYGDFLTSAAALADSYLANDWRASPDRIATLISTGNRASQNQVFLNAPVPEPGTWAMLVSGFAVVGTLLRRKRRIPLPA